MTSVLKDYLENVLNSGTFLNMTLREKAIHITTWSKSEEGKALIKYLVAHNGYSDFDNQVQVLGTCASSINLLDLADWLLERASIVGCTQAENDLISYNTLEEFEAYAVMLLAGIYIDFTSTEYEFDNGVKLLHTTSLQNRLLIQSVQINNNGNYLPLPKTDTILAIPFKHKKFHWSIAYEQTRLPLIDIPYPSLEEVKLCLVLARPLHCGIQSIAHSVISTDDVPVIHPMSDWSLHSFKLPPIAPPILNIEMNYANELIKKLNMLEPNFKTKILSLTERLNGYSSGASMVERAIDLRICLESIFLDDGNKEKLRYRLSLRASLFLGSNLKEKEDIKKKMKKAYDVTSTAVHTGRMPSKNVDLLPEVAGLARKAILKLISTGKPNWQELEEQNNKHKWSWHITKLCVLIRGYCSC